MDIEDLRNLQDKLNSDSINEMLRMVEINPTELCTRTCSFCPRHDKTIYKNQNKHIDIKTIENLCNGLKEMNFNNRIGFVGFGEPLLCKNLIPAITKVKELIPDIKWLEVNTNGDKLTFNMMEKLYTAGISHLAISMYDEDKTDYFTKMKKDLNIKLIFRHHYDYRNNYNLKIVNRSDILKGDNKVHNNNPCYLPFYKMFIDWNGDILLCDNNWKKDVNFGNVNKDNLKSIWLGDRMNDYRKILKEKRDILPCKNCNISGTLRGEESVKIFEKYESCIFHK